MKLSHAATRTLSLGLAAALVAGGSLLAAAPAYAADPELPPGTVTLIGTPEVGAELSFETEGWPAGTTLTYEWFYSGGNFGSEIEGETGETYTVTADLIGLTIGVLVYGDLAGFTQSWAQDFTDVVAFTQVAPATPAPVADSADLPAYLADKGSAPQSQASAGLPAEALTAANDYTASLLWGPGDSFVDVYLYSSPVFIGTIAIVDGIAQIPLSAATLAALAPGAHTLVVIGQSSGLVQSLSIEVAALAATGSATDAVLPLGIAGGLLLLGGAFVLLRRRARA